jgi:hypothetical protein
MKFAREHVAFRFLWLVMALNILNCSVDTPDAQPDNVPEDLSYNDMESIVEIVLEEMLGINNAIAECDEPDEGNTNNFSLKKSIDFYYLKAKVKILLPKIPTHLSQNCFYQEQYSEQFHPEIVPPPPKA